MKRIIIIILIFISCCKNRVDEFPNPIIDFKLDNEPYILNNSIIHVIHEGVEILRITADTIEIFYTGKFIIEYKGIITPLIPNEDPFIFKENNYDQQQI